MRTSVWLVLFCLIPFFRVHALEIYFYSDNLGTNPHSCNFIPNLKSDIFIETYYSKLKPSDYKIVNQVNFRPYELVDITKKKSNIHFYSKKVKSGYLYINKCVTSKIAEMGHSFNGLKITKKNYNCISENIYGETRKLQYIFNGRIVRTKDDVKKVLKLKKEQVEVLYVIYNEYINTYIVSFVRK